MEKDLSYIKTSAPYFKGMHYMSLSKLSTSHPQIAQLPFSIRVLLENILCHMDGRHVTHKDVETLLDWESTQGKSTVPFCPGRVLMQDFTGVPAIVDLASIRTEVSRHNKSLVSAVNPKVQVDLVVDHSVIVDYFGTPEAKQKNVSMEYSRNGERYRFLKWAQGAFRNLSVIPPGMGICHQVNLEYLSPGVLSSEGLVFMDTLVGTDSHTPMINAMGVLGWGVGGIEAEAAMLGQPLYMVVPQVVGLRLGGRLTEGVTATDLVLTITKLLRSHGVVGRFVEVFGEGVDNLGIADRATISNMSPEFGCTDTHFAVDEKTLDYLHLTGRVAAAAQLGAHAKANLLWRTGKEEVAYSEVLALDLSSVESTLSGPKHPQSSFPLSAMKPTFEAQIKEEKKALSRTSVEILRENKKYLISDGAVVIAAITSCTNTSNPNVMIGAGLLAKRAVELGLRSQPWVKTSLAPGSLVVTRYLMEANLMGYLERLGFHVVGYGCTTCIGNSGDLPEDIQHAIQQKRLFVSSVLSGNRNFEARIHPLVQMNFLASPLLVIAYAIAGRVDIDIQHSPLGYDGSGKGIYLRDIWPKQADIDAWVGKVVSARGFKEGYAGIYEGDSHWQSLDVKGGLDYGWDLGSTYIQEAPFFKDTSKSVSETKGLSDARILLHVGDMVTTDHISPAGKFDSHSEAGKYLLSQGVEEKDFNSYGSRRGNHEVMQRGTFANVRLQNKMVDTRGGYTRHYPSGDVLSVYGAAERYGKEGVPLVVIGGSLYGSGSSRDWAAKGTALLGVKAVLARSFERIHRANLVGMGILPVETEDLGEIQGDEFIGVYWEALLPHAKVRIEVVRKEKRRTYEGILRLDSQIEVDYYQHRGILPYVMHKMLSSAA